MLKYIIRNYISIFLVLTITSFINCSSHVDIQNDNDINKNTIGIMTNNLCEGIKVENVDTSCTFEVAFNQEPEDDITINFEVTSSIADDTRVMPPSSIIFDASNWNNPQTITVNINDDNNIQATQATININASYFDTNFISFTLDNDDAGLTVFNNTCSSIREPATIARTCTFSVQSSTSQIANLPLSFSTSDTRVSVAPTSILSGNNQVNNVTVSINPDLNNIEISDTTVQITISANSHIDTNFNFTVQPPAFIAQWQPRRDPGVSGSSGDNIITLPLHPTGTYNFTIDWGDGSSNTITSWNQAEATHTYLDFTNPDRTLMIIGTIQGFVFNNIGDRRKLVRILNWGQLEFGNVGAYFRGAIYLETLPTDDAPRLHNTTSLNQMFDGASIFNSSIAHWDVSNIIQMDYMFINTTNFNQNLTTWDVDQVTSCSLFDTGALSFNNANRPNFTSCTP